MDITGLRVSIEVDMSGFVEAMEELVALIETVEDEMMAAAKNSGSAIQTATKSAHDAADNTLDVIEDIVSVSADLVGLLGAEFDPLDVVSLALDSIKLFVDLKKASDESKESTDAATESTIKQGQAIQNVQDTVNKGGQPTAIPFRMKGDMNTLPSLPDATSYSPQNVPPAPPTPANNQPQSSTNALSKEDYQKHLADIHNMVPPKNAKIDVSATAIAANKSDSTNTTNIQNNVVAINNETDAHNRAKQAADEHATALQALGTTGAKSIETLAEGIGQMAAGKKVNIGAAMIQVLGDGIEEYGKHLIEISGIMALGVDPLSVPKLAEGTALVGLGAGLKAIKMADGGIVHGSTFANIGEYAGASHNPEVVAPLDKLRGMVGGGGGTLTTKIQGSDLLLVLNKEMDNQGLSSGGNGLQQYSV